MFKRFLKIFIPILITFLIFFIFFKNTSIETIQESFQELSFLAVFIYVIFSLTGTYFRALRYKILLSGKLKLKELFLITLVRNFSVDLLPARTASLLFYTYLTNKDGIGIEEGGASFFVALFYDVLSLSVLLSFALLFIKMGNSYFYLLIGAIFFLSIFLILFIEKILILFENITFINKIRWIGKIVNELKEYFSQHRSFKERTNIFIISLIIRILKYLSLFALFVSLTKVSVDIKSLSIFSFGLSATELSSVLPVQGLAGFGTWELSFKYVFQFLKVNIENPFVVGLVIHSVTQVWEYSIGLLSLLFLILKKR